MPLPGNASSAWLRLEHALDAWVGVARNPLRHLGALACLLFAWLAVSGFYLFAVLDSSAATAYVSIDRLGRQPWTSGGWLRSVHRYAADAFVIVLLAHVAREWMLGRFRDFRRYAWLTGVPLLLLALGSGVVGFWLNWDRLGQYSVLSTVEWLDALPIFGSPLARNFINPAAVTDRLFSLIIFIHVGVPLLLVFGLWFHVQRMARAAVLPPAHLALAGSMALLALAFAQPVRSQGMADLSRAPGPLNLDWILLFVHPLTDATSAPFVWLLLAVSLVVLFGLPFLPRRRAARQPVGAVVAARATGVARVDPPNCNGCRRCVVDCPYAAVTLVPHPDWQTPGRPIRQLAQVDADLCAGCGICVGACPSSTPFRSGALLVTGIDMPQQPINAVRSQLVSGLAALQARHRFVVIGCDQGPSVAQYAAADVLPLSLICIGMLPPAFVEYALRAGAAGVVITGCQEGDCGFRWGQRWTEQRLHGQREPHLRQVTPPDRWRLVWPTVTQPRAVDQVLDEWRRTMAEGSEAARRAAPGATPNGEPAAQVSGHG